jgi:phage shock protein PspC (stress-responsive transcriptional regulator)
MGVSEAAAMTTNAIDQTAVKRLERSRSDRMVAGVCEGLARYFDLNPAFYRVGFVVLTLLGGAGILIYLAAVLVIPEEGKPDSIAAEALRGRRERPWSLIGVGLIAVAAAVLLSRATLWPQGDAAWVLVLLAGAVILWTQRSSRTPSTEIVLAADGTPVERPSRGGHVIAVISVILAVMVVAVLTAAATVATVFHVDVRNGVGERTYQPALAAGVQREYKLGIGELRLDLAGTRFPVGETRIDARVGIGELNIIVPPDVALRATATARAGEVEVLGRATDGRNADLSVATPGLRVLVLDAKVGLGTVHIRRALP